MTTSRLVSFFCAAASLLALSACESGSVKQTLGLSRNSPDEFRVLPRPALSVPPQFALRPPGEGDGGESAVGEVPTSKQAESLMLGTATKNGDTFTTKNMDASTANNKKTAVKTSASGTTGAENQFLQNAGANAADPKVRQTLTEEKAAVEQPEEDTPWWDFFPDKGKKEPIVQPSKETERLTKNKQENKPVTEGDTPETKARDRGVLGAILGD